METLATTVRGFRTAIRETSMETELVTYAMTMLMETVGLLRVGADSAHKWTSCVGVVRHETGMQNANADNDNLVPGSSPTQGTGMGQ